MLGYSQEAVTLCQNGGGGGGPKIVFYAQRNCILNFPNHSSPSLMAAMKNPLMAPKIACNYYVYMCINMGRPKAGIYSPPPPDLPKHIVILLAQTRLCV